MIPKGALGSHEVWNRSHESGLGFQGRLPRGRGKLGSRISLFIPEEELDLRLIRTKGGVDAALEYAKAWSRYAKELLAWTDKRANYGEASFCPAPDGSRTQTPAACRPLSLLLLELEFAKSIMKLAEAGKVSILQQVGTSPLQPDPPLPRSSTPPPIRSVPELAPHSAPEPNATPVHLHLVSGA